MPTYAWEDIRYYCVAEPKEYHVDFKVYELLGTKDGQPVFQCADTLSSPDPVSAVEEAQVYLSGHIKWDGCANLLFDAQEVCGVPCSLHFCGKSAATSVGTLLGRMYDLMPELLPRWGGD